MKDLHNQIMVTRGLSPAAATTDNTAYVSQIADTLRGESLEFVGQFGSIADADVTFTVLVEDGNDSALADAATVAAANLLGVVGMSLQFDSDDKTFKIGYKGNKRYVRVTITPASNSGNIFLAAVWIHGHPKTAPQSTQLVSGQ